MMRNLGLLLILLIKTAGVRAQLHLDFAKETKGTTHVVASYTGGENAGFVVGDLHTQFDYKEDKIGLEPHFKYPIHTKAIEEGFHIAQYSAHAKYLRHTFLEVKGIRTHRFQLTANDSNIYAAFVFKDSFSIADSISYAKAGLNYAIVKFNSQLKPTSHLFFSYDTMETFSLLASDKSLLVYTQYKTEVNTTIDGNLIKIPSTYFDGPAVNNNNFDWVFFRFDENLKYQHHKTLNSTKNTWVNNVEFGNDESLFVAGQTDSRFNLSYDGDTLQQDSLLAGFSPNPMLMVIDKNGNLLKHWVKRVDNYKGFIYASRNDNGNVAITSSMAHSTNISYVQLELFNSNLTLINTIKTALKFNSQAYSILKSPTAMGADFGFIVDNLEWNLKDTVLNYSTPTRFFLSSDSLKLTKAYPFNDKYIKQILNQDENSVLGTLQFNGQATMEDFGGKAPPYKLGDPLFPSQTNYGVFKYVQTCVPITVRKLYDSMVNCADQYGMYQEKQGKLAVDFDGTGASFQWYATKDTSRPLIDQKSPLQGGINFRGNQSPWLRRSFGTNQYSASLFSLKVGGACTPSFWVDTFYHEVWGAPIIVPVKSAVSAKVGDTVYIEARLSQADYPLDSVYFQWYRGGSALLEGNKFKGTKTPRLTVSKVQTFDAGNFSCAVTRYHCRDWNTPKRADVNLVVTDPASANHLKSNGVLIYPNPAKDKLRLDVPIGLVQDVEVVNTLGQVYYCPVKEGIINIERLKQGSYYLRFKINHILYHNRFIKL